MIFKFLVDRLNAPQIEILGKKSIQTKKSLNRVVEATMMPPKSLLNLSAAHFLIRDPLLTFRHFVNEIFCSCVGVPVLNL